MINGHIILHNGHFLSSLKDLMAAQHASNHGFGSGSSRFDNTVGLVVRLLHCFIELVSVSGDSRNPCHGCLVENQDHEGVIGNSFPLAGETVP